MTLQSEILALLKRKATGEWEYVNPHFLLQITEALEAYYQLEDDTVDKWVQDMFGA